MTFLSHLGLNLARWLLGLMLLAVALPALSQDQKYVLLADNIELADAIHDELQYLLAETPNDIEIDEQQQALFTGEGEQIDFSEVFHQDRMRDSQAVSIIFEEYAPDYLVLAWSASDCPGSSESGASCVDSAYGVSQKKIQIRLRVLDSNGRNVHQGSASTKSKLGVSQPTLQELLADTVAKLDFVQLENAIAKHTERKRKRGQPIKVAFENVSQKDYFEKLDDFIELLRGAGAIGKVRDQHDKGTKTLTVRTTLKGDLDEFYRGLYRSALGSAGLDNFELDRKGNLFVFTALPPTRKRLVISGLTPDQYHHRLEIYREAIASVEGVKQVDFEFVQGAGNSSSKLVFAFTYPDDIHVLEEQLWKRLESAGEAINRQLVAVSDTSIQYSAGTDVSDLRQVTLRVGRVDRNAFRRIDPPLESSLQSLRARNLSKTYDDKSRELLYHFQIGETTESLTASIESTIEATPALDKLVVESIGANLIAFSYQAVAPASLPATVELHGLNEQDYQTVGREFAALIEGIRGVERLRQDYSPAERVLQLRFHYQGKISLSQYLYRLILQSPSLAGLSVTQSSGKITLTPLPPERRRLVIAGLSAERYHHRLEAYRTAITSQEGVTEAAHEYLAGGAGEPGQLVFSFNFSGNLAVLEDHIWASLVATGETPNRQLTAVSERLIQYQAGGEAVLTAVFRNVAAAEYSRVREALDSIFGNLEVRNLTRDYNDKTRVLSYNFESGQAMVELDATLGQQIEIEPALQGLVPAAATDTSLEYSFLKTIVTVAFNNITSEDYGALGATLDGMVESLGGRDISKAYDDEVQSLSYRFDTSDTALHLDELIRQQIDATPALDNIVPGAATDAALEYNYLQDSPLTRSVTLLVQELEQDDSDNVIRELNVLVQEIYGVERLRHEYSATERVLQLRFNYQGRRPFFGTLYPRLISNEALNHLKAAHRGKRITLTPLPPERRRLVIAGLSAERYHHRLEAYRTAITSQEGVTEAAHEYLAGGAGEPGQLVFSFNFSGNLAVLEDHIWASLVATGETPNRQLTAVSERLIQYQAGGEAVLTAVFRNVAAAEYSRVREALDSIFGNLEVRNLTRDYGDKAQTLVYRFESGQAMVELDATLWQQIEIEPALQGLVPGIAANAVLEYSFLKTIVTVAFNNIAPEDYRKIGALLDTIIKQLVVKDLKKAYDPNEYRLSYTLESPIPPVELDTILWEKIRGEKALSNIAQDTTSEDTLGYFYLQKRPDTRSMAVVLENLGPDAYRKAGLRFVSAIKVIEGVDRVQREYSENDQVLRLRFRYRGESIYAIDDAIWKAVRRDKTFTDLALGSMTEAKLVYVLGAVEGIQPDVIIHLRRVSGADYKIVATGFSKLLGRLKNVRDVRYHYLFQQRTIVFRLRYGGEDLFTLDDAIQHSLAAHQLFQQVAKGPDTAGRMIYLFGEEPVVVQSGEPAVVTVEPNESAALPSSGSLPDLVAALDQTVIVVLGESEDARWHGTGFFVTDSGYILTNAHVAMGHLVHEGKAKLWAKTLDGHRYPLNVIKSDNEQDLALLKIVSPTRQFKSVKIGNSSQLRKGQQVFNIGNPGTWDEHFEHSVTIGVVAGLNRNDGLIEFSMPGRGGQSGSPVFNTAGTVVGVVVKVTLDDSGKALIPVLMATVDTSGKASFKVENKLIDVMTRNETITMAIPINHARNLLQLTGP